MVNTDVEGNGYEKVYKAGDIFLPSGLYRVEEVLPETCTIRRLPAAESCLAFRFHQKAPANWVVGCIVEARLNPRSPTGRTIKRWTSWDDEPVHKTGAKE